MFCCCSVLGVCRHGNVLWNVGVTDNFDYSNGEGPIWWPALAEHVVVC